MLGVMTGICAPAQSSAMPHAAHSRKKKFLQSTISSDTKPNLGLSLPRSLFCLLPPNNGGVDLRRKEAMQTFTQLILQLILSFASILYHQQGSLLQSSAVHTPLKNDAFKFALWCSKLESALNNNKDQH